LAMTFWSFAHRFEEPVPLVSAGLERGWQRMSLHRAKPARTQNPRLSSVLTPVFKLGCSATIVAIGVACTYADLRQGPVHMPPLGLALAWPFILLLAYGCLRLKKVIAHPDHLLVSNYITDTRVPYDDVEEIRARRGRSAVFVRLRLRTACRFGRTVYFLLPSTIARIESQPEVRLLRERCPQLCERSGSWWLATLYLRPRATRQGGDAEETKKH
jgi:hypothetical protein